jgi:hypothetical protein
MAKFPTDVDESVTIAAPRERVYVYLWDVVGSSRCVPDLATCERVGPDTYRFASWERSAGPVSMLARYTARYEGNGAKAMLREPSGRGRQHRRSRHDRSRAGGGDRHAGVPHADDRLGHSGAPPRAGSDPVLRAARSGAGRAAAVDVPLEAMWEAPPRPRAYQ